MRYLNTFPLPIKKVGNSVFISIYHLAEWLVSYEEYPFPKILSPKQTPHPQVKASRKPRRSKRSKYDHLLA
jgi:hypothetical protein